MVKIKLDSDGNTIRINEDRKGKNSVYTAAEVDAKISEAITIILDDVIADEILEPLQDLQANHTREVLNVLNSKCTIVDWGLNGNSKISDNCNRICTERSSICIGGILNKNPTLPEFARPILCSDTFMPFNDNLAGISCICCKP